MNNPNPHPDENRFHEYLDGVLEDAERRDFEGHLQSCDVCQKQLAAVVGLFATIEGLPELELGIDLAPVVMRAILSQARPAASLRWAAAAQAILGAVILGVTWPVLNALEALPDVQAWLVNLEVQAAAGVQILSETWFNLVAAARGFVPQFSDFPALELSYISLVAMLASATLLWLVGNGLLLRHPIKNG